MDVATKAKLTADRFSGKRGHHDIPGVGRVTFRALSRQEMMDSAKIDDDMSRERYVLSRCIIEPRLTDDDVRAWQENSPAGEMNDVAMKINVLSGIGRGADKSDLPEIREPS